MGWSKLGPEILRPLKSILDGGAPGRLSDADLLDRCSQGVRDESAFAALVERHHAMVLRACRGVLGDPHAAEDAAQVTFLVLARKAGSLRRGETIAPWLYGVAVRVSAKMRVGAARRRKHERIGAGRRGDRSTPTPADDVGPAVLEEVGRLPEKYRAPVVLCYFDGLSHEEAASRLGWPVGTVRGRLARARDRLRARLDRRGLSPSAGFLAAPSGKVAGAVASSAWVDSTVAAALRFAGAGPGAAGAVPEALSDAANDALRGMIMTKAKMIGALVLVSGVVAGGAAGFAQFGTGGFPEGPEARQPPQDATPLNGGRRNVRGPETASGRMRGVTSTRDEYGGPGPVAHRGTGPASVYDEIARIEDDPDAVDALLAVAVIDATLAKSEYEKLAISGLEDAGQLMGNYDAVRAEYIGAIATLAAIRRHLKERGVPSEDLPPIPTLNLPEEGPDTPDF